MLVCMYIVLLVCVGITNDECLTVFLRNELFYRQVYLLYSEYVCRFEFKLKPTFKLDITTAF